MVCVEEDPHDMEAYMDEVENIARKKAEEYSKLVERIKQFKYYYK